MTDRHYVYLLQVSCSRLFGENILHLALYSTNTQRNKSVIIVKNDDTTFFSSNDNVSITSQRAHDVMITLSLRQNDATTSFWCNNNVAIMPRVAGIVSLLGQKHSRACGVVRIWNPDTIVACMHLRIVTGRALPLHVVTAHLSKEN